MGARPINGGLYTVRCLDVSSPDQIVAHKSLKSSGPSKVDQKDKEEFSGKNQKF